MRRVALFSLLIATVLAGCGGAEQESVEPAAAPPSAPTVPAAKPCAPGATRSLADAGVAAVLLHKTTAYRAPGGAPLATFSLRNVNGVRTTFRVLEARLDRRCAPSWYRVQLPIRPNGSEGWIRAAAVRRFRVDFRIVVDLSDRHVTVYRGDEELVSTPTAIGRPETPTPVGSFYVNQRLLAADPAGPFGPGGIGISAFSPTLTHWAQGGPIAIHGTNEPESIGQVVSNGCLRIDNAVLERLIHVIPDGTPVLVRN